MCPDELTIAKVEGGRKQKPQRIRAMTQKAEVHMIRPEFILVVKKDGKDSRTFIQLSVLREPSSSQPITCFLRLDF